MPEKDISSKEKLNTTLLFAVKLLFFVVSDTAFGHKRAGREGVVNS
jgi:hypothetical protein